jgi:UDP-glucose 4,6-dehydratase
VLSTEAIDTVMHFAAQTHVDNSFGNSLAFTLNNTYGTHVLLEACRLYGAVRRFVNVSTDEVYGETSLGAATGLTEASRLEPTNPYSAAKAGAEMMAQAYLTSYRMPIITTRGNNVYGPHQFPEKVAAAAVLCPRSCS